MTKRPVRKYNNEVLLRLVRTFVRNGDKKQLFVEDIMDLFRANDESSKWCLEKLASEGFLKKNSDTNKVSYNVLYNS